MNAPPPPPAGIAITAQYFPLMLVFAFMTPQFFVNGYRAQRSGWGRNMLPVYPGRHHVHVHTPYLFFRHYGSADYIVDVPPGGLVELEYKAPCWAFSGGALGPAPQPYPGLALMIGIIVTITLTVTAVLVVSLILAMTLDNSQSMPYRAPISGWIETVSA